MLVFHHDMAVILIPSTVHCALDLARDNICPLLLVPGVIIIICPATKYAATASLCSTACVILFSCLQLRSGIVHYPHPSHKCYSWQDLLEYPHIFCWPPPPPPTDPADLTSPTPGHCLQSTMETAEINESWQEWAAENPGEDQWQLCLPEKAAMFENVSVSVSHR